VGELEQSIQAKHNYSFASAILPLDNKKMLQLKKELEMLNASWRARL